MSRSALRNPERCISDMASRNKRPHVRSRSREAAPLHLGVFLPANISTNTLVKTAIFEGQCSSGCPISDQCSHLRLQNLVALVAIYTENRINSSKSLFYFIYRQ